MRNNQGFTIVELLVTIAILGILSSMAFRSFAPFYTQQRLKVAAIELAGYFRNARAQALRSGGACVIKTLTLSPATYGPKTSFNDNKCNSTNTPNLDLRRLSGLNNVETQSDVTVSFVRHGFAAGINDQEIRITANGTTTEWCINILTPSAIVRVGVASKAKEDCNYTRG